jgi:hypothetical protein
MMHGQKNIKLRTSVFQETLIILPNINNSILIQILLRELYLYSTRRKLQQQGPMFQARWGPKHFLQISTSGPVTCCHDVLCIFFRLHLHCFRRCLCQSLQV